MTPFEAFKHDFSNKKVLVMGLGIQGGGVGVVKFLQKCGALVTITDMRSEQDLASSLGEIDKSTKLTLGRHDEKDFENCDYVIRNPGVPKESTFVKLAEKLRKPVFMEAALFAKYTSSKIIGITGTRGKTTTTTLIYNMLKKYSHRSVAIAGNIPGKSTIELLESPPDSAVLELSSWQLQGFDDLGLAPAIAVLTNIFPDHLNRYASMTDYINDKAVITKYQQTTDYFIYNQDDDQCLRIASSSKAQKMPFSYRDLGEDVVLKLRGKHNRANAAAADKVGALMGIEEGKRRESLGSQESIPYRLEKIALINGITYINDTTSTTPIALMTALETLEQKTIVIVGGQSKKLPTNELVHALNTNPRLKGIILIPGTGTKEIIKSLDQSKIIGSVNTLDEAVALASKHAVENETILFSPGFTSFDQYRNEFERGDHFNLLVRQ